jgi:hypothetical protein
MAQTMSIADGGFSREAELTIDEAIEDVFNQSDEVLLDKPLV